MNYPSTHELERLKQQLTDLLGCGCVPKDTEVVNLAFELEWSQFPPSNLDLIERYQRIRDFRSTQS